MTRYSVVFLVALLTYFPAAAQQSDAESAKALAESVNRFGLDLYGTLPDSGENRFFSPYSIAVALAMTREGAAGETATEMDRVFHFPSELARHQASLQKALIPRAVEEQSIERRKVNAYQLEIANALWGQEGKEFVPEFLRCLEHDYIAPLRRVDFHQSAAARKRINDWVGEKTDDKIADIVRPPLPTADTRLVLANAIYFKASWAKPFKELLTKDVSFFGLGGEVLPVKMMHRNGRIAYAEDGDVQVVEIPYRGRDTSMVLVVPRKRDGLPEVEKNLNFEKLSGWLGKLDKVKVELSLPKFRFSAPLDLTTSLPAMGMPKAFSAEQADFSGISIEERLHIGAVLHEAFVGVDEKGTEASAATVEMIFFGASTKVEEPKVVVADHPFLFFIRERKTGCVLLLGRLMAP